VVHRATRSQIQLFFVAHTAENFTEMKVRVLYGFNFLKCGYIQGSFQKIRTYYDTKSSSKCLDLG
jgi:hypothetical protein